MFRSPFTDGTQILFPFVRGLPRQGRHQIDVDIVKPCPAGFPEDLFRLAGPVDPAQQGQFRVVNRLHADGEPVDTRPAVCLQPFQISRSGVDFHTDLCPVLYPVAFPDSSQDPFQLVRRQQGRGAAAQKDGIHLNLRIIRHLR